MTAVAFSPLLLNLLFFLHFVQLADSSNEQVGEQTRYEGEDISGPKISDLCRGLVKKSIDGPDSEKRVILFQPDQPIQLPVRNLTLSLPKLWVKEPEHKPNITVFLCWEGIDFVHLKKLTIVPGKNLVLNNQLYEHHFAEGFAFGKMLCSVAIVVDRKWNNADKQLNSRHATLFVQKETKLRRETSTKVCDESRARNQPCCLWPIRSTNAEGKEHVAFHTCIGHVYVSGGKCRENQKRALPRRNFPVDTATNKMLISSDLFVEDAVECAIFE